MNMEVILSREWNTRLWRQATIAQARGPFAKTKFRRSHVTCARAQPTGSMELGRARWREAKREGGHEGGSEVTREGVRS